jgi:hypothetical protein
MSSAVERVIELRAGQENVLLPEGVFKIDRNKRPDDNEWYDVEYDPFDQFITVVGRATPPLKPADASCKCTLLGIKWFLV